MNIYDNIHLNYCNINSKQTKTKHAAQRYQLSLRHNLYMRPAKQISGFFSHAKFWFTIPFETSFWTPFTLYIYIYTQWTSLLIDVTSLVGRILAFMAVRHSRMILLNLNHALRYTELLSDYAGTYPQNIHRISVLLYIKEKVNNCNWVSWGHIWMINKVKELNIFMRTYG